MGKVSKFKKKITIFPKHPVATNFVPEIEIIIVLYEPEGEHKAVNPASATLRGSPTQEQMSFL